MLAMVGSSANLQAWSVHTAAAFCTHLPRTLHLVSSHSPRAYGGHASLQRRPYIRVRAHHRRTAVVEARRMFGSSRSEGDLKHGHKDDHPSNEAQDQQIVEELPGGARPGGATGARHDREAKWEEMDAATRKKWEKVTMSWDDWHTAGYTTDDDA